MIILQACSAQTRLSPKTLLAMLNSQLDKSQAIVAETGEILQLTPILAPRLQEIIDEKVADGVWAYQSEGRKPQFAILPDGRIRDENFCNLYILKSFTGAILPEPILGTSVQVVMGSREGRAAERNYILKYINNGTWLYYEQSQPKRLLLTNPNWSIDSFDPSSRKVCVTLYTKTATGFDLKTENLRHLNFTLNPLVQ
jgi:hypothetical protein